MGKALREAAGCYTIPEMKSLFEKNKSQWGKGVTYEEVVSAELHRFSQFCDRDETTELEGVMRWAKERRPLALSEKWVRSVWDNYASAEIEDENFIGITYKWLHLPQETKEIDENTDLDFADTTGAVRANVELNPAYWGNLIGKKTDHLHSVEGDNKHRLELIAGILQMNGLATKEDIINELKNM